MEPESAFNPLEKRHLGKSVVDALLAGDPYSLAEFPRFKGAGVYAIYYFGDFPAYADLARRNREELSYPIYVGKADPKGGRKGESIEDGSESTSLYRRLSDHRKSIKSTENLNVDHFRFRLLVVDDVWISLGESLLISRFKPVWNVVVDGFGNHHTGKYRYSGKRSPWDELHPGRGWAKNLQEAQVNSSEILAKVEAYFKAAVL